MTIIPDQPIPSDDEGPSDRPSEQIDEYGARVEDSTRRIAAAIAGALEGFAGALDRYDVANEGKRALRQAGDMTRAAAVEAQSVAQTPEMRQVGDGLHRAGVAAAGATHRATEEVKARAEAVGETGRRARVAPRAIGHELSLWVAAWKRGMARSLAGLAMMALFATFALIVLTIALVAGLNELIGDPAGTFVVALLYVGIAGMAFAFARSARMSAALEREERMANAREEMRHVVRPVRDAFGRGRTNI